MFLVPLERLSDRGDLADWNSSGMRAWRRLAFQVGGIEDIVQALRQHIARTECGPDPHQVDRLGFPVTAAETANLWSRQACLLAEAGTADVDRVVSYVGLARGAVERAARIAIEAVNRSIGMETLVSSHPLDRPAAISRPIYVTPVPELRGARRRHVAVRA
jgi:hypothetical protein